ERGLALEREGEELGLRGKDLAVSIGVSRRDLAQGVTIGPGIDLVTASALLDLTSRGWLEQLARGCSRAGCAVLMALSYNGLIRWQPGLEDDVLVRGLINRHQRSDKGFGPALGPAAWEVLVEALEREGYRVSTQPSNWLIPPHQPALQRTLVGDWADIAVSLEPLGGPRLEDWRRRRLELIEAGRSRLQVGHMDLLALP
ncbi:MAG: class I SAM-dependent methyltransferase, partial [Candidatus Competibacteraceae bacterium]|nr:class I SAM-dependent methyltransferase [Candidatus Competibacteraceae bacterium]